ncbi:mitochondrial substrate carrier family protein G [Neoconidiobolus thromboides FSU 785]|nr:mitochondrial substrate carrier family protein G [Neoconidiobolus thromboides FSU 785]
MTEFMAGTVGGCCEVLVGHPFDTIKVRIQTQDLRNPIYKGAVDCFKKTLETEKVTGLYRGVTPPLITVGFCSAIIFSSNGYFRRLLNPNPNPYVGLEDLSLAGAMTGSIIGCFYCPMELLKIRMQTQTIFKTKYNGLIDCAKQTIKRDGLSGMYRGFGVTLTRDMACFAGYFSMYHFMRNLYIEKLSPEGFNKDTDDLPFSYLFLSGGLSGIACWLTSYPQDIIKSNIQSSPVKVGVIETIKRIYRFSGLRGFTYGLAPTLLRSFPANAATFIGYETAMKFLNNRN